MGVKNILVTGGAGYVGSHVLKKLAENGCNAVAYDNLSQGHRKAVDKNAVFVKGDLKDKKKLGIVFKKYKIDAIMHLAACVSVEESVKNPEKYYANNVSYGINLLNIIKSSRAKYIIFSSSSIVYGSKPKMPLSEDDETKPKNPYGKTKLIFENMLKQADIRYGIKSISLRYFNAAGADINSDIGECHHPETHLIPNVLSVALGHKKQIDVFGNDYKTKDGTAVRDYVHVSDIADGHVAALDALYNGHKTDIYNMGNEKGHSVLEIIKAAGQVSGKNIPMSIKARRFGDVPVAVSDSKKINSTLGWKPKYSDIKTIIRTAWNWHQKHPNGFRK